MMLEHLPPPMETISREYFEDSNGTYYIDDLKRKVYKPAYGYEYYFEKNEDGTEYPVKIIPNMLDFDSLRRSVVEPTGFPMGNGCFRRGMGGNN